MMINPELYVEKNTRGKTRDEILAFIREEQANIKELREYMKSEFRIISEPSEEVQIAHAEECIKLAQAKLEKLDEK